MRIVYSLESERDLKELFDYIAQNSGVQRAELVLRRIERTLETLADWPFVGRVRPELHGEPRSFSVWPWIVIYEPQPSGRGIYVWRVLDGCRALSAPRKDRTSMNGCSQNHRLAVFDTVALLAEHQKERLARGQVGTVVETLDKDSALVEFSDDQGRAYAIVPCAYSDLMVLHYVPQAA